MKISLILVLSKVIADHRAKLKKQPYRITTCCLEKSSLVYDKESVHAEPVGILMAFEAGLSFAVYLHSCLFLKCL
ncbi:hypothetical protein [Bacillus sp. LL01]|uniref:hypothetical protein n=1 Tax=Bacillus sp. LL01 TaxID=1665556 RepID=UPI001F52A12E|nr:hypothetical protein [Bacillus sp. LL01]